MNWRAFAKTASVCPVCLRKIEAERAVGEDGRVYLVKRCPEHGEFSALIWEGGFVDYLLWDTAKGGVPGAARPAEPGCPNACGLCTLDRVFCPVCFASAGGEGAAAPDPTPGEDSRHLRHAARQRGGPATDSSPVGAPPIEGRPAGDSGRSGGSGAFATSSSTLTACASPPGPATRRSCGRPG